VNDLRSLFLLDPEVHFLNHGSFGATPRPVFEVYQAWQRRLERQPVAFMQQELAPGLRAAREAVGALIHAAADEVALVPNATFGVNVVARSLNLGPGDEVLTSDHEYGACRHVWQFLSQKRGFRLVTRPVSLPAAPAEALVEQLWQGVTPPTRVIFLSHITSATAVRLPIEAICARARAAGILTLIDGAHALGQLPLDMEAVGADFYTSNAHKWLCSPKGSAILYVRRDQQALIEPLVVSWGWGEDGDPELTTGNQFLDLLEWLGTVDPAAYLSVPAAIAFQAENDWTAVRHRCHALLREALGRIEALTGLPSLYPDDGAFVQMAVAPLPAATDVADLKARLLRDHRIEIPCLEWGGWKLIRLSIQGYNTSGDVDALLAALAELLPL
jgi:isopenicillin-N epimerase